MKAHWRRHPGRKASFALALLATLLALFYAAENWRGARAWSAYRRDLAARGESLDFDVFLGPPVPPERNLASLPIFARWGSYTIQSATGRVVFAPATTATAFSDLPGAETKVWRAFPGAVEGFDLDALQRYYRSKQPAAPPLDAAGTVLRALEPSGPFLDELAAARAAMPTGQFHREFSMDPRDGSFGSFGAEMRVNVTLLLRANALLAARRAPEALRDLETAFWLRRATCGDPPLVLPLMLGAALLTQDNVVLKNGLDADRWNAGEIARLQAELEKTDVLAEYVRAMRGERARTLAELTSRPEAGVSWAAGANWKDRFLGLALLSGPRGWIDQNRVNICRWYQDGPLRACDVKMHRIETKYLTAASRAVVVRDLWSLPYIYVAANTTYFLDAQINVVAELQAQTDEMIVTCALKRYALANDGHFPAALDELTPQFLARVPPNVFAGSPPGYRLKPDGGYQLAIKRPGS